MEPLFVEGGDAITDAATFLVSILERIFKRGFIWKEPHSMRTYPAIVLASVVSAAVGGLGTLLLLSFWDKDVGNHLGGAAEPLTFPTNGAKKGTPSPGGGLSIDDPRISLRQLGQLAETNVMEDPEAAVRRAASIPGYDNREAYLGNALRAWGEKDGRAAALFVSENFQGRQLTDTLYYVADGWAETDPVGAAEWFLQNTSGPVLDDALWEALESWGRKNPEAAFAWSANLDEYQKSTAMQGLAEGWGAVDPEGAAAAGMEFRDSDYGKDFLVSVMTQWAGSAPETAAAWTSSVADERLRAALVNELGEIWAESDPVKAASWATAMEDSGARKVAEIAVATGWSIHDPGSAAQWAVTHVKDPDQLEEMIGDITFNWSNLDPRGATDWLQEQTAGPDTDLILGAFSSMILDQDPESALAWASKITESSEREGQLRVLVGEIVSAYGDAGRRMIEGLDLPEALKREFTAPVN